jgi:hypothetical protein
MQRAARGAYYGDGYLSIATWTLLIQFLERDFNGK